MCGAAATVSRLRSDAATRVAMMQSVGAFASNGDPNNAALGVTWAPWPQKLIFDASLTAKAISVQ